MANEIKLSEGMKLEVVKEYATDDSPEEIMTSRISTLHSNGIISITMPMFNGFTVALHPGDIREIRFFTDSKTWYCNCEVIERREEGNLVIADIRKISRMQLYTRRKFFRVNVTKALKIYKLNQYEIDELRIYRNEGIDMKQAWLLVGIKSKEKSFTDGVMTDVSGGGIKIITKEEFNTGDIILVKTEINNADGKIKSAESALQDLFCKVVACNAVEKHPGTYVCRVRYIWMEEAQREQIVQYVFSEDRKQLKASAEKKATEAVNK